MTPRPLEFFWTEEDLAKGESLDRRTSIWLAVIQVVLTTLLEMALFYRLYNSDSIYFTEKLEREEKSW